MKSQLNSQELDKLLEGGFYLEDYVYNASPGGQQVTGKVVKLTPEAKAKLLQLALSCLIKKEYMHHVWEGGKNSEEAKRINMEITAIRDAAIDTMEQKIKDKFGGSDV